MDREAFNKSFRAALAECLADPQLAPVAKLVGEAEVGHFERFVHLLRCENEKVNLTAITDPAGMAVKHVADSLLAFLVAEWPQGASVCDVGTGGGLPGLILALVRRDLELCLVDAVLKKLRAVERISAAVGLAVETVHARAEELGRRPGYREGFDVVTARAVAFLPALAELCLPLVRVGGWFVALKGPEADEEIEAAAAALRALGGELGQVRRVTLPLGAGGRTLIGIRKTHPTPDAYPRRAGIPAKNPILEVGQRNP